MGLETSLQIATGGLADINLGLGVISQNVANASTPDYAVESFSQQSIQVGGQGLGVRAGLTLLATDPGLQSQLQGQTADQSYWQTTSAALSALQPALGAVGAGTDLGSLLGALQSGFSTLLTDPGNQTQQGAVVSSAAALASGINRLDAGYDQARQTAQNTLVTEVGQLNTALAKIGALSDQIVALQAQGQSTADLANQRAQAITTIAQLAGAHSVEQPDGDVLIFTSFGAQLPTHAANPLSIAPATTNAQNYYPGGGLPGILLGGSDITAQLRGGQIGANLALRDTILPAAQAGLDEFSYGLASRFDAQGLTLFSDSQGAVPTQTGPGIQSGYVGFAGSITVNPAVAADPSLVRDGTHAVAGSATGATAFTPNPQGLAGFTDLITRVLDFALGTEVQAGVQQAPGASTGLGAGGTLASGFAAQGSLGDIANAFTAAQAASSAGATSQSADATALQTALQSKLTGETGVDMDTQLADMVRLQNAYGANAKVISTVQTMFAAILATVQ